jgi:hypothetical protein
LLRSKRFATNTALIFRTFLVLLKMFTHNRGSQSDIIAFFTLREFGMSWRRNTMNSEEMEKHVIALDSSVTTEFTSLNEK